MTARVSPPATEPVGAAGPWLAGLTAFPVKSCAGVAVRRAGVTAMGLAHDREFMVVDAAEGTFCSQRQLPRMSVVRPEILDDGACLSLSAPDFAGLRTPIVADGARREVSLFGRWFGPGVDQGDPVAEWFSDFLGRSCRLVRIPPDHGRVGSGELTGPIAFSDSGPILVCSLSSLDLLNERIVVRGGEMLPMNRFRPNLVVSGWPEPHTEDRVRRMRAGGVELGYAKRCVRCPMPTVRQETGEWNGPEPSRTLRGYRKEPGGGVSFGMMAAVLREGELAVGDAVDVLEFAAA